MWEVLYESLKAQGHSIKSIWIADVAHQGQSGILNEGKLGDDRKWSFFNSLRRLLTQSSAKQRVGWIMQETCYI